MRQDVKELADAMERGWYEVPNMSTGKFFKYDTHDKNVIACCALGHLRIGLDYTPAYHLYERMPILGIQYVVSENGGRFDLFTAIVKLNDEYHWSTRDIIAWLRSHQ
jgi:hypothetical protein